MNARTIRRVGVIVNYLSLVFLIMMFYLAEKDGVVTAHFVGMALSFGTAIITFYIVHKKTGLWGLTHRKIEKLDEREIQLTHDALRYSYAIFSIFILGCIFIFSIPGFLSSFVELDYFRASMRIIFAVLMYLAHTLPASIIAWKEKEV